MGVVAVAAVLAALASWLATAIELALKYDVVHGYGCQVRLIDRLQLDVKLYFPAVPLTGLLASNRPFSKPIKVTLPTPAASVVPSKVKLPKP